jgi:hypothetical protein
VAAIRADGHGIRAAIAAQFKQEREPCRCRPGALDVRVMDAIQVVRLDTPTAAQLRPEFAAREVWVRPYGDIV